MRRARECARPAGRFRTPNCKARQTGNALRSAALRFRRDFRVTPATSIRPTSTSPTPSTVFGGERRTLEGLRALAENQTYQLEASVLTLTSNVAASAIGLAATREQIEVTRQIIAVEEKQLHMIGRQYESGARTHADVLQQQSNLASVRATLPGLQQQLAGYEHALAVLTGQFPHDAAQVGIKLSDLKLPAEIPVSLHLRLGRTAPRHPGAGGAGASGPARPSVWPPANMLPQLTLTGSVGDESLVWSTLLQGGSSVWSIAGGLTQPIFEGGTPACQAPCGTGSL